MLATHDRLISDAFIDAVDDLVDRAEITRIIRALEVGDIERALDALNISDAAFDVLAESLRTAYLDGGRTAAGNLPAIANGARLVFRFDARNLEAERWLKEESSRRVTAISQGQRQAMREVLRTGMEAGNNPRTVALDIVGRVQEGSNRRSGGIIGLSQTQGQWVANAKAELRSGDPVQLKAYLRREKRDKRFDAIVRRAINQKRLIPASKIDQMTGRYADRLLKLRADMIARTESLQSLAASQHETYRQAIAAGKLEADQVTKIWKSVSDPRVRDSHTVLHNQSVGFEQPFQSILGSRLMHPGDTSLGARAGDIIGCRCMVQYKVDFMKARRG